MTANEILNRLALYKKRPDLAKELTPGELADLVLVVLEYVKKVQKDIEEGRIKGEPGQDAYTPEPDIDYLSLSTARKEIRQVVEAAAQEMKRDIRKAIEGIRDGRDGADAIITDEHIRQAAELAAGLIQLPDFPSLITAEPQAIRDSLELLQGDERLDMKAIRGLTEVISELRSRTGSTKVLTGKSSLALLNDVSITNPTNGQVLTYNATTKQWEAEDAAAGGGSGDVTGPASSVDSEVALFSGTGGKTLKRASVTGLLKAVAGVLSAAVAGTDYYAPGSTDVAVADGGTGASNAADARSNLGAAAASHTHAIADTTGLQAALDSKQASDATLTALAGLATAADKLIYATGSDTFATTDLSTFARTLIDDADASTARGTLGLGTMATQAASNVSITGGSITGITDLAIADGGTGASTAAAAFANLKQAASDTATGVVELATIAETNTGTDSTRALTPDGLAGSNFGIRIVGIQVTDGATALAVGDGKAYFRVPAEMNGMNLVSVGASLVTRSTSGTPTIQIARGRQANATTAHAFTDMLSTRITIDANEYDSKDAAAAAVIDAAADDIATGDLIRVDVDVIGTGSAGLNIVLGFQLP